MVSVLRGTLPNNMMADALADWETGGQLEDTWDQSSPRDESGASGYANRRADQRARNETLGSIKDGLAHLLRKQKP
jgi:hypothetical protein